MARTDAALLLAARTDPAAFRELYERYAEALHGFHLRRTGDDDAAYDLTAETFAQAWLSRARFRDEADGSAAPWLYGIARNVLLMSVRRRRLERSACERLGVLTGAGTTAVPDERWLDGLDEALAELPEGQRQAVALRFAGDLEYDAVADALGTTPQAARVRVHRALSSLRQRLAKTPESP
ncbi:MAG TPA: sigma-70 family RNA polymerase sigma factor [Baekduia sp.]|nr:sigma-70 family RNA polymerase sigma factor [Baekduia sp.]